MFRRKLILPNPVPCNYKDRQILCHRISVPKKLESKNLSSFLYRIEFIFSSKLKYPIFLELHDNFKPSYLSLIIIYMILKTTCEARTAPMYFFVCKEDISNMLSRYGFNSLYRAYISGLNPEGALDIIASKQTSNERLYILPQPLKKELNDEEELIIQKYIEKIYNFYSKFNKLNAFEMISSCITEAVSNFWSHSIWPEDTIIFAQGDMNNFYMCLIDTGDGIISNLAPILNYDDKTCLLKCVNKGVSSKAPLEKTYHMGRGLYYLQQIVTHNKGELNIWSEGYHLTLTNNRKNVSPCGYWKGCILEVRFRVDNAAKFSDLF